MHQEKLSLRYLAVPILTILNLLILKYLWTMTKLSVNINKLATLRNSRGGNNPDVIQAAIDAQRFGL